MTTWFTDRVDARAVLARRLAAKGEAFLRQHYLHPADLEVIATQGEAAKEADREQQVQLAEGAQARTEGRDRAAELRVREATLSALLPAVISDLSATRPSEAGFLAKLSFARYRTRVRDVAVEPPSDAETEVVRRVERVERADRRTRAAGLAALCATLREREAIVDALQARGMEPADLEGLRADAETVAQTGSNKMAPSEATARESAAVRAQNAKWSAVKHLVRRACAGDPDLARLLSSC